MRHLYVFVIQEDIFSVLTRNLCFSTVDKDLKIINNLLNIDFNFFRLNLHRCMTNIKLLKMNRLIPEKNSIFYSRNTQLLLSR